MTPYQEPGDIEFERLPGSGSAAIKSRMHSKDSTHVSVAKVHPADRQTDREDDIGRDQQPVVCHQDRRHK